MGASLLVLLVVATFFTSAISTHEIDAKRFLRTPTETNDEERGWTGLAFLDNALESVQLKLWQTQGKSADEAFKLLKVDDEAGKLLGTPQWKTWVDYVSMVNKNDADETIASKLLSTFGADKMAKLLDTAKKNPNTEAMATRLEAMQLKIWLANDYHATPEKLFSILKLDKGGDVLDSPQLAMWTSYLKLYNEKNPGQKSTELEMFTKSYGEAGFLILLVSSETTKATTLKNELIQGWLQFTIPPAKLFKQLNLDKAGDDLLTNPLLSTWTKYLNLFNKEIPRRSTTMIETFTKSYGDAKLAQMIQAAKRVPDTEKFATNLQAAQFKLWMVEAKSPDTILKSVLKLDSKALKTDPNADIWRAYYRAYDKEFPERLFSFTP